AKDLITDRLNVTESERAEVLRNGVSRVGNQIDWARFYLAKTGYLDSSKRGVWTLTEKGRSARLSADNVREIVRQVNAAETAESKRGTDDKFIDETTAHQTDHRSTLLLTLKALPPRGFEELCRYLLLESGFEEVSVTGRSGDGGIDGHGVLRVSKLVSMK